jgi:hypothetical protein
MATVKSTGRGLCLIGRSHGLGQWPSFWEDCWPTICPSGGVGVPIYVGCVVGPGSKAPGGCGVRGSGLQGAWASPG